MQRAKSRRNAAMFASGGANMVSGAADALREYVRSNDQLLQEDPTLSGIMHLMATKLFSNGIVFVVGDDWLVPDDDFMFIVRNYWESFMFHAFSFIVAHGFLVWYPSKISKNVIVPEVPDFSQITIDMFYDEQTGQPIMNATWRSDKVKTPLKIFHKPLPFRITPESRLSMVDKVKPLLRVLYQMTEARLVASYSNANPPMVVQRTKQQDPSKKGVSDELDIVDPWLEFEDKQLLERGIDEAYVERIQMTAMDPAYQTYVGKEEYRDAMPSQWWEKAEVAMRRRPESRFLFVPGGLQYVNSTPGHIDPDYSKVRLSVVEEIHQAFGIPPSMISTQSSSVKAGVEMHNTTFINTMQMWWRIYSLLMTDVFRILHGKADFLDPEASQKEVGKKSGEDITAQSIEGKGKLFRKEKEGSGEDKNVTVFLRSQFITSPEQVEKLYSQKVIPFNVFQRLRTDSVGIPDMLIDPNLKEPLELLAQEEILLAGGGMGSTLKPQTLPQLQENGSGAGPPKKKQKSN